MRAEGAPPPVVAVQPPRLPDQVAQATPATRFSESSTSVSERLHRLLIPFARRFGPRSANRRAQRNSVNLLRSHRQPRTRRCSLRTSVAHTCVGSCHSVRRGGPIDISAQAKVRSARRTDTPPHVAQVRQSAPVPSTSAIRRHLRCRDTCCFFPNSVTI